MSKTVVKLEQDEIQELQEELRLLKLDHNDIKKRIIVAETKLTSIVNKAREHKPKANQRKLTLDDYRSLAGQRVRILSPKTIEEIHGTILKVGSLYVTIILPSGRHLRRIPKNLTLIDHD